MTSQLAKRFTQYPHKVIRHIMYEIRTEALMGKNFCTYFMYDLSSDALGTIVKILKRKGFDTEFVSRNDDDLKMKEVRLTIKW